MKDEKIIVEDVQRALGFLLGFFIEKSEDGIVDDGELEQLIGEMEVILGYLQGELEMRQEVKHG